ncbi:STAS domain-containing protein [Nocardia transvalensis]|uniref:STAS domain-containing protein n=1 Tax=Nocardia transvalensis TaxID=37333 RepID=UPI001894C188|nr:STAS domain-containing protein [Nocardia transvalensis]MBF6326992.1 STAS domain-containing protein [Nocardia transvalensis]
MTQYRWRSPRHPVGSERSRDTKQLRVRHRTTGSAVVLHVDGDVDQSTKAAWHNHLELAVALVPAGGAVVIDLSRLGFLGSAGLHVLTDASSLGKTARKTLCLAQVPPVAAWMLTVAGLDEQIPQYPDIATALRRIGTDTCRGRVDPGEDV